MNPFLARFFAFVLMMPSVLAADQILLWPNGAPGSQGYTSPEAVRINPPDEEVLSNINAPSVTPFLPEPAKATGAAVIVIAGGGHRNIWITHEGYRVAEALAQRGVAAFVLRYRLALADGTPYRLMDHSLADVQRAIRLVKFRALEWHIDPARVGVMGFSAGGHLTALAGLNVAETNPKADDPIDRLSSRAAFLGLIYAYVPDNLEFTAAMPPSFFLFGDKDDIARTSGLRYNALQKLGVPSEIHVLSGVAHGFGIRASNPRHVAIWPELFVNWLDASGFLKTS